jgi:hypothetical protein
MCRPSCFSEAYSSPGNYWLLYVGLLAAILFYFNLIFLSGAYQQWQNEWHVLLMSFADNPSHSVAMDGR